MAYANAHRGKMRKEKSGASLRIVENVCRRLSSQGWAEMIRKVYEVDPTPRTRFLSMSAWAGWGFKMSPGS